MKKIKAIICLSFLLMTCIFMINPKNVNAADYIRWKYSGQETDINVERGAKFYLGDYVMITSGEEYYTGSMVKGTYATSAKKIVTVNKKGQVTAKKVGTADITFKYKGQTLTAHMNVVAKGGFEYISQYKSSFSDLQKESKKLSVPNKITSGNVMSNLKKERLFLSAWGRNTCKYLTYDGFANKYIRPENNTVNEDRSNDLIVPQAGRYLTLLAKLREFERKNDPTSRTSTKNNFSVKKATGSGSTINVTLKKSISQAQIAAVKIKYPSLNDVNDKSTVANMAVLIYASDTHRYYRGKVTLKKGSKSVSMNVVENTFPYTTAAKLSKKTTYSFRFTPNQLVTFKTK